MKDAIDALDKSWSLLVAVASGTVAVAAFIQTTLSIIKSRYELKKLRAEDQKLRKQRVTRRSELVDEGILLYEKSDFFQRRLERGVVRWITITFFLCVVATFRTGLLMAISGNEEMIKHKRAELNALIESNRAIEDLLTLARAHIRGCEPDADKSR